MFKKICFATILGLSFLGEAMAHDFWIHSTKYSPNFVKAGAATNIYTGYGHAFPVDDKFGREANFSIIGPDNTEIKLEETPLAYKHIFKKEGNHLISGVQKASFWTKHKDDKGNATWKNASKEGIKNVISSKLYNNFAKAVISVGNASDSNFSKVLGHTLEIVPLENPNALLGNGSYLKVKVLFNNEPLASTKVYGTYAGFSNKGDMALVTYTNKEGIATIKVTNSGYWMLKAEHGQEAPKDLKDKCDEVAYSATLTFQAQ